jgi:hypothetical protein
VFEDFSYSLGMGVLGSCAKNSSGIHRLGLAWQRQLI